MRDVDEASDVEIGHVMHDLLVGCRIRGRSNFRDSSEKKLPNLFVHGHFAQRGFTQAPAAGDSFFTPIFAGAAPSLVTVLSAEVLRSGLRVLWP